MKRGEVKAIRVTREGGREGPHIHEESATSRQTFFRGM